MTRNARIPALFATAAACVGISACGSDDTGDPIPHAKATRLEERLDAVQQAVDDRRCDSIDARIRFAEMPIASLGDDGVGSDVQDALADGVDNLRSLARNECEPEEEPVDTTPETVPTEPVPPPPTETAPVPPPTDTTPVPEPVPEPEADEGDGGTQFDPDAKVPPGKLKRDGG